MGCDPSIELPWRGSTNEGSQPKFLLKMCQVKEISKNYNQILPIFRVLHYSAEKSSCNPDCRGRLYVGGDQPAHLSKQMFTCICLWRKMYKFSTNNIQGWEFSSFPKISFCDWNLQKSIGFDPVCWKLVSFVGGGNVLFFKHWFLFFLSKSVHIPE